MARQFAPILLSVWQDDDFKELSEAAQRAYFLAISQPKMNYAGVVPFMPGAWSQLAKDSTPKKMRGAVAELHKAGHVVLDATTEELWVKGFIRHNHVLDQPNVRKAMQASYEQVASPTIRRAIYEQVPTQWRQPMTKPQPLPQAEGQGLPQAPTQGEGLRESVECSSPLTLSHSQTPSSSRTDAEPPADTASEPSPTEEEEAKSLRSETIQTLIDRRLDRRDASRPIVDLGKLRDGIRKGLERDHGAALHKLVHDYPNATSDALADLLEPPELVAGKRRAEPLESTQAAAKALRDRDRSCVHCNGTGWQDTTHGAVPCNHQATA